MTAAATRARDTGAVIWQYPYEPLPRQLVAHQHLADEMLYGGAAGGGKSDWLLAMAVQMCLLVPGGRFLFLRRTFPDLERTIIPRLLDRIPQRDPGIARYNSSKHTWRFKNGAILEIGHLDNDSDVLQYQGAEYQGLFWDELTQFTEFQYRAVGGRLRASGVVAARMAELGVRPFSAAGTNPGGPGHHWVKARWIDPAPAGRLFRVQSTEDELNPGTRIFIPSLATDNKHLNADYLQRLDALPPEQRKAQRDGDWNVLEGVRFKGWRPDLHVIEPEQLPIPIGAGITRAVGVDYGIGAPFCALWGALFRAPEEDILVIYRELYRSGLSAREQARAITAAELPGERDTGRPVPVALDPSCWARGKDTPSSWTKLPTDTGPPPGSIAYDYDHVFGSQLHRAFNERLTGVQLVDQKLRLRPDGLPRLMVYSTCRNLIRTLPALPRAKTNPEDIDTKAEDHAYDALRYLAMFLAGESGPPPIERQNRGRRRQVETLRPQTAVIGSGY